MKYSLELCHHVDATYNVTPETSIFIEHPSYVFAILFVLLFLTRSRQYKVLDLDAMTDHAASEHAPRVSKRQEFDDVTRSTASSARFGRVGADMQSLQSSGKARRSVSDVTSSPLHQRQRLPSDHLNRHLQAPRKSTDDSDLRLSFNRVSIDLMQVHACVA